MLDKELFFSLCEKYNVELSKTAKTPMIRDAEGVHAITEEDVKQILTPPQKYFANIISHSPFYIQAHRRTAVRVMIKPIIAL